jgi:pyruvate,water dikinase
LAEITLALDRLPEAAAAIAGGKGASLGRLSRAGLPVPPGFVITAAAFETFLEASDTARRIASLMGSLDVDDSTAVAAAAAEIRRLIAEAPVPDTIRAAIRQAYTRLPAEEPVAVRSSAVAEDGEAASFAGQQESYLNVAGAENVLDRIRDCWASFFSPRALFYRARKAVLSDSRMAVVVQTMVQADTSGVLFTVDPIRQRRDRMIVEAGPGLGEAIVSGETTPDHYVISRSDGSVLDRVLADEMRGGVLGDEDLARLCDLGLRVESVFGRPQDIEWCTRHGEVFLLQSRPITALAVHG